MSKGITHLVISVFEEDIYKITVFQDVNGGYLTMNIEFNYDYER
jgi:hypothetical protein